MILFVFAFLLSCLATLLMATYAFSRRDVAGAKAIGVLMLGLSWWTLAYALQLVSVRLPQLALVQVSDPLFWLKVMFVGVIVIPPAFLVFVLQYTGYRQRIGPGIIAALAAPPVIILATIATDHQHGLFMGGFSPGTSERFEGGPVFWVHTAYSYLLVLSSEVLLLIFAFAASPLYRRQAILLFIGALMPAVANLLTVTGALPEPYEFLDLSPFGFLVLALMMLYTIRREGFLNLMPVARSQVVELMKDAVMVTDNHQRLIDFNPAARRLFTDASQQLRIGMEFSDQQFQGIGEVSGGSREDSGGEGQITLGGGEKSHTVSVQHSHLKDRRDDVRGHIYVFRDISELKRVEASLRHQLEQNERLREALKEESIRDPLTGLFNRRWLESTLGRELARASRDATEMSLCLIDLDHFKRINDTYGHDMGDRILVDLAEDVRFLSRDMDIACRFGGEEFLLILPMASPENARKRIDQLLECFRRRNYAPEGPEQVTFSAGIAAFPIHGESRDTLFRGADAALYRAKRAGRNLVTVCENDLRQPPVGG
ncbi:histidine kinase N-terminal 7TM domain-containing protein [Marinobacter sp.]|uniref:histidine kinase N-terminal 7TM domain-containing diguanylate cyclase n=1 Tax=Marinobacter sp. TaxID=50741 RepID=UPI00384CD507